jgi:hypothetical protein
MYTFRAWLNSWLMRVPFSSGSLPDGKNRRKHQAALRLLVP